MKILRAYGLALLSVTIALLLTLVITPIRQQFRFLLCSSWPSLSARRGGFWPGVFATLLSVVVGVFFVVRNEDVACRLGGDEFVLVLPDTSAELAAQRVEELRNAVAHMDVQYQGRLLEPMTLSFGIATFPENGRTLKDLLRASDNALFRAKEVGRNGVRPRE